MQADSGLVLALDAGGTSTRCLLVRSDGTVLGRGRSGPGNHILCGWDAARGAITAAIRQACTAADIDPQEVRCVVAGSAGVGPHGEGREPVDALLSELAPVARVRTVGDMVIAFWGGLNTDFGVVASAGTGSVCYGRNLSGKSVQVGGWGHLLGDEGSAYDLAVRALRAAARATDGRGPRTVLTELLADALGVRGFIEVALRVYAEPMSRDAIAGLATIVTAAANQGDGVARDLLTDAGRELGLAAVTTLQLLNLATSGAPVAYSGAVFAAGEPLVASFRRAIASSCPHAAPAPALFPPIVGAFKLALLEVGVPLTGATAATLRATLGGDTP